MNAHLASQIGMTFLRELYALKQARGDADAEQFRATVCYEFTAGLNATLSGSAYSLRRWIANRAPCISDVQHARRVAALADIDTVINPVAEAA